MEIRKIRGYVTSLRPDPIGHSCVLSGILLNYEMTRNQDNCNVYAVLPRVKANYYEKTPILRPPY